MHEAGAFFQCPVNDEMHMSIHERKSKYHHLETLASDKNAVHPVDEILFVIEHNIHGTSICTEMPAITNMVYTSLHKGKAQPEIRIDLRKQPLTYLHHNTPPPLMAAHYKCSIIAWQSSK